MLTLRIRQQRIAARSEPKRLCSDDAEVVMLAAGG